MQAMMPMVTNVPALTVSMTPHFAWGMLAVLFVAGLAVASSALRARLRANVRQGGPRAIPRTSAPRVAPQAARQIAA